MLYSKNATVYIATRSKEKALNGISQIKSTAPESTGSLVFLHLDLSDLSTIKSSAQEFLSKETKLHVLFNNASVMNPAQESKNRTELRTPARYQQPWNIRVHQASHPNSDSYGEDRTTIYSSRHLGLFFRS